MNLERFQNSPAGRLLKVWQARPPYWAFVPNPLPPHIEFDRALVSALSDADRALGELAGLGRTLPNPNLLIRPFIRREAVLSSRIEGTQADVADLYAYEAKQLALPLSSSAASDTDVREVHLLAVSERGNWQAWLEFFLRGVAVQSRDAIARARQIQDLQAQWRQQLTQTRASALLLRLVDSLFDTPMLTIPQAQK